jgi:nucleoside-diphosphate-sugar epimerase
LEKFKEGWGVRVSVTGGLGYIGACVVEELTERGDDVRVLDSFLHGQEDVASLVADRGAEIVHGDVRDPAACAEAFADADAVVHLAAIVGDPACAKDPALSNDVNLGGSRNVVARAREAGARRLIFASTCSNYGRMADPTVPITEEGELAPVSLYAEQKVQIERALLDGGFGELEPTCLRFATVYGAAPRMRFDLTVNEFTRDLWADRELEVFGEQFWRPYVHVRDAARAVTLALSSDLDKVGGRVFNIGHSDENYRKLDLVELITGQLGRGNVTYVRRSEDPRDYKVGFERVRSELGFEPEQRLPDGIRELIAALERQGFGDPYASRFRNS